jgi:hypothetical protein
MRRYLHSTTRRIVANNLCIRLRLKKKEKEKKTKMHTQCINVRQRVAQSPTVRVRPMFRYDSVERTAAIRETAATTIVRGVDRECRGRRATAAQRHPPRCIRVFQSRYVINHTPNCELVETHDDKPRIGRLVVVVVDAIQRRHARDLQQR